MTMLIAWHALNKFANAQDARFTDTFLIATPGITIRDRLRVLLPNDPGNYYRQRDTVSPDLLEKLQQAKFIITNFHAFRPREKIAAGKLTKAILAQGETGVFTETPDQMVRRVCRELGNKKNIIVINDEAHHCYRRKPDGEDEPLTGDERKEAEKREEEARVWISGVEAVKAKLGLKAIYDLSATPFFFAAQATLRGTLFPWVVSDFSLIDAIESGIVKVPRVPVADDSMTGDQPTYRDLWIRIREHLPKKGRKTEAVSGEPKLPRSFKVRCTVSTATTRSIIAFGRRMRPPEPTGRRPQCSSSSATTRTSQNWFSITSPVGKKRSPTRASSCRPGNSTFFATTTNAAAGSNAPTPFSSIANNSNPATP